MSLLDPSRLSFIDDRRLGRKEPNMLLIVPRGAQRSVNRGIGGLGIELRKLENRDADVLRINGRRHVRERKREPLDSPA